MAENNEGGWVADPLEAHLQAHLAAHAQALGPGQEELIEGLSIALMSQVNQDDSAHQGEPYPPFAAAQDDSGREGLPPTKGEVFEDLKKALTGADTSVGSLPRSLKVFLEWFSVYKNYRVVEHEGWFSNGVRICIQATARILSDSIAPIEAASTRPHVEWLEASLKLVYIFARVDHAFLFFERNEIYGYALHLIMTSSTPP